MGGVCYVLNTASAATYVLCCAAQAIPHALCGVLCCTVQAAHIPCPDSAIHELIDLMDYGRNGVISWDEFSTFMTHEYNAGKKVREGEYMLPSGKQGGGTRRAEAAGGAGGCKENAGRQNDVHTHTDTDTHKHAHAHAHVLAHTPACCRAAGQSLNFGFMIAKLKRSKLMRDIEVRACRRRPGRGGARGGGQLDNQAAVVCGGGSWTPGGLGGGVPSRCGHAGIGQAGARGGGSRVST